MAIAGVQPSMFRLVPPEEVCRDAYQTRRAAYLDEYGAATLKAQLWAMNAEPWEISAICEPAEEVGE